jgi:hypothetical protein
MLGAKRLRDAWNDAGGDAFSLWRRARARLGIALVAASLAGCITEVEGQPVVTLPKEAFRYERFIEAPTFLDADRVTIQALTAYRKDVGIATDRELHMRRETKDRIEVESKDPDSLGDPVKLSLRNMHVTARKSVTIIFSDLPLLRKDDPPVLVLVEAEGLVHFRGDGVDLHSDRVIVRNDEAKAFPLGASTDASGKGGGTGRRP